jgi:hypothetical protein
MNEGDELIPTTVTRKKKRSTGFRFSSKKALECSKLTRLSKARGCDFTSVTRTLLYPSSLPSELCTKDIHGSATILSESLITNLKKRERSRTTSIGSMTVNILGR